MDAEPEDRAYTAVNVRGFGSAEVWIRLPGDPETAVQKYSGGRPAPSRRGQDRWASTLGKGLFFQTSAESSQSFYK